MVATDHGRLDLLDNAMVFRIRLGCQEREGYLSEVTQAEHCIVYPLGECKPLLERFHVVQMIYKTLPSIGPSK